MAFDLGSARPIDEEKPSGGFDISTAKGVDEEVVKPSGKTPSEIYYNFVVNRVKLPQIRASLKEAGMEFDPKLYREALMSVTQTPEAVEAQRVGTAKVVESGLRGGAGGVSGMAEAVTQLVPGETATDVAAFFREQERKQREAAPIQEVYGATKTLTELAPYVGLASKVAKAKTLATPFRQLIAQPTTQAAATYALTPERAGEKTLSDLVVERQEPEGALFGMLPTTGSTKADAALNAFILTGALEAPFAAYSGLRGVFPKEKGMPPGPEEAAAYKILKEKEAELTGSKEGETLDAQISAARQEEEARRAALEELQRKQAEEAARRQQENIRLEAERNQRQQALIEQRRQAELAEQEAKLASQERIRSAEDKREQIKETAESEAERLRLESESPKKEFPDEDEILRQEKINDAAVEASGTLENAAAKLDAQAAKRQAEAEATTATSGVKLYDLGDRVRQIFIETRNKLVDARNKAMGKGAEDVEEGKGLLAHEKDVAARESKEMLSDTKEFGEFESFINEKVTSRTLTTPLKRVYEYIKREIDTEEGAVPWERLRNLRREVADKISPTPEVSFGALTEQQNKALIKEIDNLLDSFVGGTKGKPGSYRRFIEGYKEASKPLEIFKFGPGKTATEMGEWGRGLEYDREDVIKAVMHPTRSNAEAVIELAGDKVDDLADVVRSAILKEAKGDPKKLRDLISEGGKYDEFLSVDAFSGIRSDLSNLARTGKLSEGIAKRLTERATSLRNTAAEVAKLPGELRRLLNVRDFSSDAALASISRFLNANPASRESVGSAMTSLVDGMPDEQIVAALSNPAKRAALVRAGLPTEQADLLLQKANASIADRAAKLQAAKDVKRQARKTGREIVRTAREPVTSQRQKVRELGAEISKISAERRAAAAAERTAAAQERAAVAAARAPIREAKALRVDLEQKRKALTDINERPELAEAIISAAKDIPINTTEGLINATTLGAIYTSLAQVTLGSPILSAIAGAVGVRQALTQRAAKAAMLGRSKEEIRNRIKSELQQMIRSKLKREETRQVIESYEDVMNVQRKANEVLKTLGITPAAGAASARIIYEGYGDTGQEPIPEEEAPEEYVEEGPSLDDAIASQDAEDLRPVVEAIYAQESSSGQDVSALEENYAGAKGVMQVIPQTFKEVKRLGLIPEDYSFDNQQHLAEAGVAYIKHLASMYDNDPEKIAAAYYGGPSAVTEQGIRRERRDPNNPKAPTVGQYVDRIIDRMIPTAEARGMQQGGLVTPGNIDVSKLPAVRNPDGSYSTVRSMGIEMDGKHYLIPKVVNGRVVSDDEAFNHFIKTGKHLGIFGSRADSDAYAKQLSEAEAKRIGKAKGGPIYSHTEQDLLRRYSSR